jgi:hypothetical protein
MWLQKAGGGESDGWPTFTSFVKVGTTRSDVTAFGAPSLSASFAERGRETAGFEDPIYIGFEKAPPKGDRMPKSKI